MTLETCLDILRDFQPMSEEFHTEEFFAGLLVGILIGVVLMKAWREGHET